MAVIELARIIRDVVLANLQLHGLYHVSAESINKFELLKLVIDRSLDSSRFREITGYEPAAWPELVRRMREFA